MFNETTYLGDTSEQIASYARAAGCPESAIPTAVAIARAESSGNPGARLVTKREDSRGLWQINTYAHPQYANVNLYDPMINAQAMVDVSGGCQNWRPWSTFTSGAFQKFLAAIGLEPTAPSDDPASSSGSDTSPDATTETESMIGGLPTWTPIAVAAAALYFILK